MPQASYATRRGVKTPRRDQTQQRPLSVAAPRPGEPSIFGARFYLTRGWVEQRPARSSSSIGAQLLAIAEAPISQPPTPALQTLHAEALSAPPRTPSTPRPFTPRPQATPRRDPRSHCKRRPWRPGVLIAARAMGRGRPARGCVLAHPCLRAIHGKIGAGDGI